MIESETISITWILLCTALVLLMQPGFTCFESGLVRNKNNINVSLKNVADFCVSGLFYWLIGFGFMYGESWNGWIGTDLYVLSEQTVPLILAFFLFQMMFCGTAATILSGAVAERMRFTGYLISSLITATLLFPVVGHWIWNGTHIKSTGMGWLAERGFMDFAGSTVVHSVGGWIALVAIIVVGARLGRFTEDGKPREMYSQNLPLSALGTFLLFIGWFGFNGGSVIHPDENLAKIFSNTAISACTGGFSALLLSWNIHSMRGTRYILNGLLAGLVSISASANIANLAGAVAIGAVGGCISVILVSVLEKLRLDDVVSAIPVHLGGGVWGTLAVALFAPIDQLNVASRIDQLLIQLTGIASTALWVVGVSYPLLKLINHFHPLRVSAQTETIGLNFGEHGMKDELIDLMEQFDRVVKNYDEEKHLEVDHGSSYSNLSMTYNYLLDSTNKHFRKKEQELLRMASLDPLTGIANRRVYEQAMENTMSQSHERDEDFALLILDIDYFKQYNDHYGHQLGDYCLQNICQALSRITSRKRDVFARIGGEEFAFILRNTTIEEAKKVAEALRYEVEKLEIPHAHADCDFVTVSIGGALWDGRINLPHTALFDEADRALFKAKSKGRNQVMFFSEFAE
ncbi:ammonium transporter [Vibrio tubiashii]|uniref:ammonium transporter n=1 Tax=Vibrio tubiashii TaxID=29498 RepID=UPI001EFEA6F5|nr:ammonium transporter [Vibrio tubiashii]MCG9576272.1 ammonium transporter [Vibrio tubiashii]